MKKMKITFLALCLMAVPVFFTSCEDDFGTIEKSLGEMPITIPIELVNTPTKGGDMVSFFGVSDPISLEGEMFDMLQQYNAKSITLSVSAVTMKITTINESGTTVRDFKTNTTGDGVEYTYTKEGDINFDEEFTDSELTNYMQNVMLAIQEGKTVIVSAEGLTDIIADEVTGLNVIVATIIPTVTAKIQLIK